MRSTRTRNRKLTCTKPERDGESERERERASASESEMQNFCDVMKTSEMYAMEMHFGGGEQANQNQLKCTQLYCTTQYTLCTLPPSPPWATRLQLVLIIMQMSACHFCSFT